MCASVGVEDPGAHPRLLLLWLLLGWLLVLVVVVVVLLWLLLLGMLLLGWLLVVVGVGVLCGLEVLGWDVEKWKGEDVVKLPCGGSLTVPVV
mgnify:CR=1 FL=1